MDDLFEFSKNLGSSEKKKEEKSIFSVSELTRKIRNLLEYKIGDSIFNKNGDLKY